MDKVIQIPINIPLDDDGLIGRECLKCLRYFKLKPGTGLPTDYCHCPYCDYEGNMDTFWTPAQLEYRDSIAMNYAFNDIVKPSLEKLSRSFKDLERKTRHNSFFKVTVKTPAINFPVPIQHYSEKDLETNVTCTSCGLVFSVYGVFARCPDCKDFNAFLMFEKSLEVTRKQLEIFLRPDYPEDLLGNSWGFVLAGGISSFDALGKELRKRKPSLYPEKPRNLFQNLILLDQSINNLIKTKHARFDFLVKMFQVRHLFEHNMGVIDEDFVKKVNGYAAQQGRKYSLTGDEIAEFLDAMLELGNIIKDHFNQSPGA